MPRSCLSKLVRPPTSNPLLFFGGEGRGSPGRACNRAGCPKNVVQELCVDIGGYQCPTLVCRGPGSSSLGCVDIRRSWGSRSGCTPCLLFAFACLLIILLLPPLQDIFHSSPSFWFSYFFVFTFGHLFSIITRMNR